MTGTATVEVAVLRELVTRGYLTARAHPHAELVIWNYTPLAQFERFWTPETLMCRGLITTPDGAIVARPFPKFFNLEEYAGALPLDEPFVVTEKMDGSLGILYWIGDDDEPAIATRGSFESEQAIRATAMLRHRYRDARFDRRFTYLFEIIYPENRIVVDYGPREELVLLATIETATGYEPPLDYHAPTSFAKVRQYDGITDIRTVRELAGGEGEQRNQEGFVVWYPGTGLRLKVKFADYVRLHKLLTGVTARTVWEWLRAGDDLAAVLDRVPDEFYAWVRATEATLRSEYAYIEGYCLEMVEQVTRLPTRKEQAAIVMTTRYPGVVFKLLDGKPYADAIWKLVKPGAERPFHLDVEG